MISLNEQQVAAVTAPDGPVLVLAGAGTGKTRVIVERMSWLVEERGMDPRHLLALTFTNKAAAEMRQRFATRLGQDRVPAWLGTFHSFGLYVLRREMEHLGRSGTFTVFDDGDQLSLMKRLVKELPPSYAQVSPREALTWVSRLKQQVEEPEAGPGATDEETACRELWTRYHAALRRVSAVDFDDLLCLLVHLMRDHPGVCARYQRRYRFVLVDEYQDTNRAQYLIARHLTEAHSNLFVVGDEDQSIYSWRGADINNILDFAKDFPRAQVHRLEINYRSTKPILDAANALVSHNVNRLGKNLRAAAAEGQPVRFFWAEDADDEARFVVEDVARNDYAPQQVAILFRTNSQSRTFEEALRRKGLHYVVVGGIRFYSRKEVKDILAYLRLLVNPDDDESLRRVLNVPPRGIGGVTLQRIEEYAAARKVSLLQVLRDIETDETLSARARQSAQEFVQIIDDLAVEAKTSALTPLTETLLDRIRYRDFVEKSDEKDSRSRLEIVDEFLASCQQHDRSEFSPLAEFLQDLALMSDIDDWDPSTPAVTLLTCHSAKGLEFDYVYLVGMEEGLLPYQREFDDDGDTEEERRLCYVAMTRARKGLVLSGAAERVLYGRRRDDRIWSRFVDEIGPGRLQRIAPRAEVKREPPPPSAPDSARLKMGTRVRHAAFGTGVVMYTQGSGAKMKIRVRFDTGRTALLMAGMAPLEVLEGKKR
jgi:DNA helicase-2/ATP-dependent DNA helicase PcrA